MVVCSYSLAGYLVGIAEGSILGQSLFSALHGLLFDSIRFKFETNPTVAVKTKSRDLSTKFSDESFVASLRPPGLCPVRLRRGSSKTRRGTPSAEDGSPRASSPVRSRSQPWVRSRISNPRQGCRDQRARPSPTRAADADGSHLVFKAEQQPLATSSDHSRAHASILTHRQQSCNSSARMPIVAPCLLACSLAARQPP